MRDARQAYLNNLPNLPLEKTPQSYAPGWRLHPSKNPMSDAAHASYIRARLNIYLHHKSIIDNAIQQTKTIEAQFETHMALISNWEHLYYSHGSHMSVWVAQLYNLRQKLESAENLEDRLRTEAPGKKVWRYDPPPTRRWRRRASMAFWWRERPQGSICWW